MLGLAFVLFVLWLFGLMLRVTSGLLHLLLIAALVVFIVDAISNKGKI